MEIFINLSGVCAHYIFYSVFKGFLDSTISFYSALRSIFLSSKDLLGTFPINIQTNSTVTKKNLNKGKNLLQNYINIRSLFFVIILLTETC